MYVYEYIYIYIYVQTAQPYVYVCVYIYIYIYICIHIANSKPFRVSAGGGLNQIRHSFAFPTDEFKPNLKPSKMFESGGGSTLQQKLLSPAPDPVPREVIFPRVFLSGYVYIYIYREREREIMIIILMIMIMMIMIVIIVVILWECFFHRHLYHAPQGMLLPVEVRCYIYV